MKMQILAPGFLALALALPAQSAGKSKKEAQQPAPDPAQQAMQQKMTAAATPGEGHKVLDAMVGSWDHSVQWWMAPGAKPEVSTGSTETRWILGGRYLQQSAKGVSMGQPFEGMGTVGFNNLKKQYEGVWIDSMSTAMMRSTGQYDPATKTLTDTGTVTDCMDGKDKNFRAVTTFKDPDNMTYEMYMPSPDGNEFLTLKIAYNRKAKA